jgi:hypothetical protein
MDASTIARKASKAQGTGNDIRLKEEEMRHLAPGK